MKIMAISKEIPSADWSEVDNMLKKEASAALQQLPLVQHGLIEFEFTELRPYTGFSRLF